MLKRQDRADFRPQARPRRNKWCCALPMEDTRLEFVAHCGLYCELCAERSRIPRRATALQSAMVEEGWPFWGHAIPGFDAFWAFLESLAEPGCPGCRAGGGYPECRIRLCARERGMELCCSCPDFPCGRVEALGARYPMLLTDNRRLQTVGLEQWLAEQEERTRRGVVYADIRYQASQPEEPEDA
jgi:hypothetical protein